MSPQDILAIQDEVEAFAEAIVRAHGPERARGILLQAVQRLLQRADTLGHRSSRGPCDRAALQRGAAIAGFRRSGHGADERNRHLAAEGVGQADLRPARSDDDAMGNEDKPEPPVFR